MPSADPVTDYNNNNNDNDDVPAVAAPDSYGIPQGDPFTEDEASAVPTGQTQSWSQDDGDDLFDGDDKQDDYIYDDKSIG